MAGANAVDWDRLDAYNIYNVKPAGAVEPIPGVERSAGPGTMTSIPKPWHPDNPLFWVGLLLLVTFGAVAGSTTFRVGPFTAGASAGKS